MNTPKLGRGGAIVLASALTFLGLWGLLSGTYSNRDDLLRRGIRLEGEPAMIMGLVFLCGGLYLFYVVLSTRK